MATNNSIPSPVRTTTTKAAALATNHKPARPAIKQQERFESLLDQASDETLEAFAFVVKAHLAKSPEDREDLLRQAFALRPNASPELRAQVHSFVYGETSKAGAK